MAGEHEEQLMQAFAGLGVQRREELVLELLHRRSQARELALAGRRDADDVPATIVRVALPLDQLAPLERIQQGGRSTFYCPKCQARRS